VDDNEQQWIEKFRAAQAKAESKKKSRVSTVVSKLRRTLSITKESRRHPTAKQPDKKNHPNHVVSNAKDRKAS
jgi:hypothetical protein